MGQPADTEVNAVVFGGMVSNLDSRDLEPGQAQVQVNVNSVKPGQLAIRKGFRELIFDVED